MGEKESSFRSIKNDHGSFETEYGECIFDLEVRLYGGKNANRRVSDAIDDMLDLVRRRIHINSISEIRNSRDQAVINRVVETREDILEFEEIIRNKIDSLEYKLKKVEEFKEEAFPEEAEEKLDDLSEEVTE